MGSDHIFLLYAYLFVLMGVFICINICVGLMMFEDNRQ